ncbi:ATP-binding protein [Streptomyces sp. NPDC006798]|uniref:ATP-binding protein n=1 Tax=Streptomyces sp. NPDC006798 TaxID=3155462 RepID=UPI0033C8E0BB
MQVLQVQLEVGPDPAEVGRARRWARSRLVGSGIRHDEPLAETLILLISELVTNAVVHTGCPAVLRMLFGLGKAEAGTVRVEVADHCSRPPRRRTAEDDETNGRGLELVDGLADRWGWRQEGNGKAIWCEVDRAVPLGAASRPGDTRGARHAAVVREIAAAVSAAGARDAGREAVVRDGARGGAARTGATGLGLGLGLAAVRR